MTWWIVVGDLVLPKQIAGHPALELVNTRSGWGEEDRQGQEYLASLDHLCALAQLNELLDDERTQRVRLLARQDPGEAHRVLRRAQRLRGVLHEVLVGTGSRTSRRDLAAAVSEARSHQELSLDENDASWQFPGPLSLREPLQAFLVAAGDLLVERPRIDACPGHGCGWLFINRSGRRRWCQMAVCGNRAKQAAHLARVNT